MIAAYSDSLQSINCGYTIKTDPVIVCETNYVIKFKDLRLMKYYSMVIMYGGIYFIEAI